jgi:hypothetical protein
MEHIQDISCLEITEKKPVINLAIDLVAFGAGSHRACAAIFDDAGFCALAA